MFPAAPPAQGTVQRVLEFQADLENLENSERSCLPTTMGTQQACFPTYQITVIVLSTSRDHCTDKMILCLGKFRWMSDRLYKNELELQNRELS